MSARRLTARTPGLLAAVVWPCLLLTGAGEAVARENGITGRSGKQGIASCTGGGCHSGSSFNYAEPVIQGPTEVSVSEMSNYTLSFGVASGDAAARAGFNLAVSDGKLGDPDTGINDVRLSAGELTHRMPGVGPGGNFSWDFTWTAPGSAKVVTFFVCANPVNGNGQNTGDGAARCTTLPVCVGGGSDVPVAVADSYRTAPDTTLNVPAPGVLENDNEVNCDPLTAVLESDAASGSVALASDGAFTYTPAAGFSGTDSFTYRAVNDGNQESEPATVTINVSTGGGGGGGGGSPSPLLVGTLVLTWLVRRTRI